MGVSGNPCRNWRCFLGRTPPPIRHGMTTPTPHPLRNTIRPLKALLAMAGLIVLQVSGDALVTHTGWPIPGALVGLLLLLGILALMGRIPEAIDDASMPLLRHLMLFLIPSVAAVSLYVQQLTLHMALFLFISTAVTGLTLVITALTLRHLMKKVSPP